MKFYLETYGCTANKSDESIMLGLLEEANYERVDQVDTADIIILLTCTVIGTTEQRMLSRLRRLRKVDARIIVGGCMPAVQPDLIKSVVPRAELLTPQHSRHIVDLIEKQEIPEENEFKTRLPRRLKGVVAPIGIAEGCSFACAYCITSHARGRLISYPIEEIAQDVCQAVNQGCKEIQLTAQDTASYGLDTKDSLDGLLQQVCEINKDFRIRVGMMNPNTALRRLTPLIEAFASDKIYKFLHLPVQSGDDTILNLMNRKYDVDDFRAIVRAFREQYPEITLSTDVIVGFPSETEEQFDSTIQLLQKVHPDIVNITRFSPRPHTKGKTMDGRVPTLISKQRSRRLTRITHKLSREKNQWLIGETRRVLLTKRNPDGTVMGRTQEYKPVVLAENGITPGVFVSAEITDAADTYVLGKLI